MTPDCTELREHVVELVEGDLDRATDVRLRAHAARCGACARLIAVEEDVVAALRSWPPPPAMEIPVPELPRAPALSLASVRLAALGAVAAAALLLGTFVWLAGPGRPYADLSGRESAGTARTVHIREVIPSAEETPLPDDDLLALTAGVEAVVMRRPAQGR